MTDTDAQTSANSHRSRGLLDRPLPAMACVLAWLIATLVFLGGVALFGGPSEGDATESTYSTWAISHGDVACMFPPSTSQHFLLDYEPGPHAAPLWPLISGGLAAATDIGHELPYPSMHQLGVNCKNAYPAMYRWADGSLALVPTVNLGYLSWFFFLAGLIALLRASGRGRCGWEALAVLLVAAVPLTWAPLLEFYHPQDLLAMGLSMAGVAFALRGQWISAGALLGLAVTSQPFALLFILPMLVVSLYRQRKQLIMAAIASWAVVTIPLLILTSGQGWKAVVFSTGDAGALGGTWLSAIGLPDQALHVFARILPFVATFALAWWVHRRLGIKALEPLPLISLLATSLSMRLLFEQGLFAYKFMALATMLVVLDVVTGRVRGSLLSWLVLASFGFYWIPVGLAYNARPWAGHALAASQLAFVVASLIAILWFAARRMWPPWYVIALFVIAAAAFMQWPPWTIDTVRSPLPKWLWQLLVVPTGMWLAAGPLIKSVGIPGYKPEQTAREIAVADDVKHGADAHT